METIFARRLQSCLGKLNLYYGIWKLYGLSSDIIHHKKSNASEYHTRFNSIEQNSTSKFKLANKKYVYYVSGSNVVLGLKRFQGIVLNNIIDSICRKHFLLKCQHSRRSLNSNVIRKGRAIREGPWIVDLIKAIMPCMV